MTIKKALVIFSIMLAPLIQGHAQQVEIPKLPQSEAGQRVEAYIKAFNSGNESLMRAFLSANVAEDAIKRRSIDERVQVFKEMSANMKSLELRKILEATSSNITGLFKTGKGEWFEIGFQFEATPPHKLLGLRVEDSEPPSDANVQTTAIDSTQAQMTEAEFLATVEKQLNELAGADKFSGTVLIAKLGKPVFQKAYGLASKENNVPNRIDTKFNLGSINKLFTQVAIGQLAGQGKLSFDDKLIKHISDYPNREVAERITIRQLLSMTSGMGDIFGPKYDSLAKDKLRSLKDFVPLFANEPLEFEPGSRQRYSNAGYVVLGVIIEKLSGQSYYDYVRENIFKVAGMVNTDSYEEDAIVANRASGYTRDGAANDSRRNNIYSRPARGSSAGGGYSTADDLLKFAIAVASNKIGIPDFRASATNPTGVTKRKDGIGVAGGAPGINALIESNPTTGYVVIVLSNYDPPSAEAVGKQIRQWSAHIKP